MKNEEETEGGATRIKEEKIVGICSRDTENQKNLRTTKVVQSRSAGWGGAITYC